MKNSLISEINSRIDKLLNYQECGDAVLISRKTLWLATFYGFIHVFILTFSFLFFVPELTILIRYGFTCLIILTITLVVVPFLKSFFNRYFTFHMLALIVVTFYTIYQLGGIATSAGLVVACFSFVLLTIPLQSVSITIFLFAVYFFFIGFIGFIGPQLKAPEQITPLRNSIIWMINTLSMSGLALGFVVDSIRQQRKFEQLEASKQKELNEAKTKLFTNITHEFRTPLTIIGGMAKLMEKEPEKYLADGAQKINNNTNILLRLVNQMLDISKIEAGSMPVHFIQSDIIKTIEYVAGLFQSMAQRKNIDLQLIHKNASFYMDYDHDKLAQIVSNLLSNALKFTPEGGSLVIKAEPDVKEQSFEIAFTDNGIGIQADQLPYIFDRFFQVENHALKGSGTGLGLALAKELTEMLHGTISVESSIGIGSTFIIKLPVTRNAKIEKRTILESDNPLFTSGLTLPNLLKSENELITTNGDLPVLLVVEDSNDVSQYLAAILQNEFQVSRAENGKTGLEKALEIVPDIILSDVMMPEMDGIEMLGKIKADFRTSHIPVVLLTAKADIDSRLTGLERGADAYISKPFNEAELHIQLKNLVEQRKKLHERYASFAKYPETNDLTVKKEDVFMVKIREILEKNIDNEDYNINELCSEMAVSHAQLYRKFKSISNQTIAGYFKLLRLNKAKELLAGPNMNVTQVAFAVGFKNLSHFSREYSQLFGKSPSETLRQN